MRIERWTLDEIALPGKLVHQIVEWLYRENRLCRGVLKIGDTLVDPSKLSVPTLAIVNTADDVAPLASLKPFADAMPATTSVRIVEYPGEVGVCLQHLGILVGAGSTKRRSGQTMISLAQFAKLKRGSSPDRDAGCSYAVHVMTGRGIDQYGQTAPLFATMSAAALGRRLPCIFEFLRSKPLEYVDHCLVRTWLKSA